MALDEALGGIEPHKSHTQVFPGKPLTGGLSQVPTLDWSAIQPLPLSGCEELWVQLSKMEKVAFSGVAKVLI